MPLDLTLVQRQLNRLAEEHQREAELDKQRLADALMILREAEDLGRWLDKLERWSQALSPAVPLEPLHTHLPSPIHPLPLTVLASDGSSIEPDRHGVALCYLINIGLVRLNYGVNEPALLTSEPSVGYRQEELYVPTNEGQRLITSTLLSLRRQVRETEGLLQLTVAVPQDRAAVAVQDGSLIMAVTEGPGLEKWFLQNVIDGQLALYDQFQARGIPFAAYTSRPRASDLVRTLRVIRCPSDDPITCNSCSLVNDGTDNTKSDCRQLEGLADRLLMQAILQPGERSCICRSRWRYSENNYRQHMIHFFYLNVGREICRIEVPKWVAQNAGLVDLVHATALQQTRLGGGYPVALMEAHEQAVLKAGERQQYEILLEQALGGPIGWSSVSAKAESKRRRPL